MSPDFEAFEKAKRQVRLLVHEIAQLSKSDLAPDHFYPEYLERIVAAIAAVGAALWRRREGDQLTLAHQFRVGKSLFDLASPEYKRHMQLLHEVLKSGEGKLVPPESGDSMDEAASDNPTRCLVILAPLRGVRRFEGILEVFQRPDCDSAAHRGYLQFVIKMGELASPWIESHNLHT